MEKKILVIEDDRSVHGSFHMANEDSFEGKLIIDIVPKSQSIKFGNLSSYSVIFVDLELAKTSNMDGFSVIQKIISNNLYPLGNILVFTGNNKAKERIADLKLPISDDNIIYKPVEYDEIAIIVKKFVEQ